MKAHFVKYTFLYALAFLALSCGKDKEGCTEEAALNFDPEATIENGSCEFSPEYLLGLEFGTMTDQEGNSYQTIVIGDQEWMAENLRTALYANGDPIPNVIEDTQWDALITGAWSHYNNDSQYENPYGKLYNWYTVADPRNVCPTGWHVPTDAEWTVLTDYLGGVDVAGGKMKSTGTQYWLSPNADATNQSGFSSLPGGTRDLGTFLAVTEGGYWWSSTEDDTYGAYSRWLRYSIGGVGRGVGNKFSGQCVRCLRD